MRARDAIARAIGSLRRHKTNSAVATLPSELAQADDVVRELTAAGFSIVHKDEIHAPSAERCAQIAKCAWVSADYDLIGIADADMANALCEHAEAQIRELMKEVGR